MFVKVLLFVLFFCKVKSSTHWIVTEDGRIQETLESPFAMKRPDDLVSFIHQERKYEYLKQAKQKLLEEQAKIDENEDKNLNPEDDHYKHDPDCIEAGKKLVDFDFFVTSVLPLENKHIEVEDHINLVSVAPSEVQKPNCSKAFELPFSVHAYDHLEGVQNRRFFSFHPVSGLQSSMKFLAKPDDAADAISKALQKNSTSWVLYDLAAFYWRMKGNLTASVECLRRALHFSPEHYKDVALVILANILHRVHYTRNATVVMHHALKISDEYAINYFVLANMYAYLGLYNTSIKFYEDTLKRQENFDAARKGLAAVKCQIKLQDKLDKQHISLQRTLKELQEYKVKHEKFLKDQKHFVSLHLAAEVLLEKDVELNRRLANRIKAKHNPKFYLWDKESEVYFSPIPDEFNWFENNLGYEKPFPIKMTSSSEKKLSAETSHSRKRKKSVKKGRSVKEPVKEEPVKEEPANSEKHFEEKSNSQNTANGTYYDWTDPSWPPEGSCEKYVGKAIVWDEFPSAYADPEPRGFKVRSLITTELGLNDEDMHPKPWEPPNCINLESIETTPYDHFVSLDPAVPYFKQDTFLQNCLLMHVNKGYVWPEDLGQRILSALRSAIRDKNKDHLWVLYNLAGLYWRVNGDNAQAIECLRRSVYHAPSQHSDIPLVGLANIMYRMGKINDAIHLLIFALKINNTEAASYLSMGNALQAQNNVTGAIQFYSYATLLNPGYQEAIKGLLIVKCQNLTEKKQEESSEEIIGKWKNEISSKNEEISEKPIKGNTEKTNEENTEVVEECTKKTVEENTDKTQIVHDEAKKCSVSDETASMMNELVEGRADIDALLKRTDNLIREMKHSVVADNLNDKLVAAQELMSKLTRMRNSLGQMVDEAKANLDLLDVNVNDVIDDYTLFDGQDPHCDMGPSNPLSDIINLQSLKKGPEEKKFSKVLKILIHSKDLSNSLRSGLISLPRSKKILIVTSFFWRISGNSKEVLTCLLASLVHTSVRSRDLILYLISDYLAVLALYDEALKIAFKLKPSPQKSYLLANIYAVKGDFAKAKFFYKETLEFDEKFAESRIRYRAASCLARD